MILYRTAGPWGPGAGANLTAPQVDGNFYDLTQRVQNVELHPLQPIQITSFSAVGNQLYIYMSDGTVQGPLTLPEVRWFFRGQWLPNTRYAENDVVNGPDSVTYIVQYAHTSPAAFDPHYNDGQGHDYYAVLLQVPAAVLPQGGPTGFVLTKISDNNYDVGWGTPPLPPGGFQGQVLTKFSEAPSDGGWTTFYLSYHLGDVLIGAYNFLQDGDYLRWSTAANRWINQPRSLYNVVRAGSWSPVVGDEGSFMVLENGTADALIAILNDSEQNFQIGSELHVHQNGTGKVRIEGDPGVTILKHKSFSNFLLGQYATATVKKTNPNEWRLFGLLAGA